MSNQITITSGAKVRNLEGVLTGTSGIVNSLGINVPSGIPQLDGSGKILVSQLPNSVMEYKGTWDAATNTPTLVNGTGNAGDVYLVNVAGTHDFGAGPIVFAVGDQVLYSGTTWERASGATGTVSSVAVTESGDALTITGSPITTSGTINIGFAGTSGQYVNGAGGLTTFPSLTGFVPYTGATANVDLGTYGLLGDYIGFNTAPTSVPTTLGTLSWDSFYRTLQLIDGDGDTTLQIGQEQRALIHNNTGATLTDGQVVYVTGSTGELPSVALASNAIEATSSVTFGVVTETILNGADGFVTTGGMVHGLNTLAYNEGDALYLGSTAGTFTNVKPTAPANLVLIGYMIKKSGGNGSIFVKIQNGYELEELHDVSITSVANNEGIFWDSATSLWKNKTIAGALGYTPANDSLVVHLAGTETITGLKTFDSGLQLASEGSGNQSSLFVNISSIFSASAGSNRFGFNNSNNLYFNKGLNNGGILAWNNSSYRTYNLQDADGTLAFTSDIPSLSGYVPYTGATSNLNMGSGSLGINSGQFLIFTKNGATGLGNSAYLSFLNAASTEGVSFSLNASNDLVWYGTSGGTASSALGIFAKGGNVGIGTSSPSSIGSGYTTLDIEGSNGAGVKFGNGTPKGYIYADGGGYNMGTDSAIPYIFYTSGSERMRITSGGTLSVNSSSPNTDAVLYVKGRTSGGDGYSAIFVNSSGTTMLALRSDGVTTAQGIYDYNYVSAPNVFVQSDGVLGRNSSSRKYKKNIINYPRGLNDVLNLRPVLYESKNPNEEGISFTGFIAEEVDSIGLKELVYYENDIPNALHYPHFTALLAKGIQELHALVQELKAEIEELKNK